MLDLLDSVILEDEHNREEDDVGDNDEYNGNASPLQRDDTSYAAVGLLWRHGADAVGVGGKVGALSRGAVVGKRGEINLDAVAECRELDDDSEARKHEQRDPEVSEAVSMVDVTRLPESEGHAAQEEGEDNADSGKAPADSLREPHEVPPDNQLPANLQVKRERAQEHPHHARPTSHDDEEARRRTHRARLHRIRRDCIIALLGISCQWDNETELRTDLASPTCQYCAWNPKTYVHKHHGRGEANTQVMPERLVDRQNSPRQQKEDAANRTCDCDPIRRRIHGLEAVGIGPLRHWAG